MFVALGMTATGLGQTLQDHRVLLRQISGVVLVAMGVLFIAMLFVPLLNRQWRPENLMRRAHTGGPIVAGLAFAVAWLPCTGPTLGAILTAASAEDTVGKGGVLLAFYSLGLAVPFILSALAFSSVSGLFRFFRDHYGVITLISGLVLIAMGVLLYTQRAHAPELPGAGAGWTTSASTSSASSSRLHRLRCRDAEQVERAREHPLRGHAHGQPHVLVAALVGGAHHLHVAVERGELLRRLVRVHGEPVGGAPLAGVAHLAGKLEQPLQERSRWRGAGARRSLAGRSRARASPRSSPALARIPAIRAWAYWT